MCFSSGTTTSMLRGLSPLLYYPCPHNIILFLITKNNHQKQPHPFPTKQNKSRIPEERTTEKPPPSGLSCTRELSRIQVPPNTKRWYSLIWRHRDLIVANSLHFDFVLTLTGLKWLSMDSSCLCHP